MYVLTSWGLNINFFHSTVSHFCKQIDNIVHHANPDKEETSVGFFLRHIYIVMMMVSISNLKLEIFFNYDSVLLKISFINVIRTYNNSEVIFWRRSLHYSQEHLSKNWSRDIVIYLLA